MSLVKLLCSTEGRDYKKYGIAKNERANKDFVSFIDDTIL